LFKEKRTMKTISFETLKCIGSVSHAKLDHLRRAGHTAAQSVAILEADEIFNIFQSSTGEVYLIDEGSDTREGHFQVTKTGALEPILVDGLST
jgi:hypothetical protein